ncbi:hypothetical protein NMY22_g8225 [Coprinellus aureogranulatus]|nr:hypothetical protein NMY22_g8225 [Coprinellus aureogranulatus]
MNQLYDFSAAAEQLEKIAQERSTERLAGFQLADGGGDIIFETAKVVADPIAAMRRMVTPKDDASDEENAPVEDVEVVWHLQGVLVYVDLPPFMPKGRFQDKVKFLRQGIRISGLKTPTFSRAAQSVKDILAIYNRSVTNIQPPTFIGEDAQGLYLDVSNRYFSATRHGRGGQPVQFTPDVDPTGVLATMGGGSYYHGEENTVMYLERRTNKLTGRKQTSPISPVTFKSGDIVEAQITFALVPMKANEWKVVATLRCVMLLDRTFTQSCMRRSVQFNGIQLGDDTGPTHIVRTLKRRAGYDLDEEQEGRLPTKKLALMDIDKGA